MNFGTSQRAPIARPKNEFYGALARGVEYASSRYGGRDYALSFGSNEMPGYHTRPMCHVGYLTSSRHSHLDSAGYSLDQKMMTGDTILGPEEAAERLLEEEAWRQVLTSLVVCLFARGIYGREVILKSLEINGVTLGGEDLDRVGLEILRNKHKFKLREGFNPEELSIPRRIFETETLHGRIDEGYLRKSVEYFFELLQSNGG